jgi:hypothetical protein
MKPFELFLRVMVESIKTQWVYLILYIGFYTYYILTTKNVFDTIDIMMACGIFLFLFGLTGLLTLLLRIKHSRIQENKNILWAEINFLYFVRNISLGWAFMAIIAMGALVVLKLNWALWAWAFFTTMAMIVQFLMAERFIKLDRKYK